MGVVDIEHSNCILSILVERKILYRSICVSRWTYGEGREVMRKVRVDRAVVGMPTLKNGTRSTIRADYFIIAPSTN